MDYASFPLDIKKLTETGQLAGLAAGYGNVDLVGEIIAPGCFKASLDEQRAHGRAPAMLLHHDTARPVGRWDSFAETADGLFAEGRLSLAVDDGKEAYQLLLDGALGGLSVGYINITSKKDEAGRRVLLSAELIEVSLVTIPANPKARVQTVKAIGSVRDLEDLLKEGGVSNRRAKAAAGAAWRAIHDQDDEPAANAKVAQILAGSTARLRKMNGERR